ncbi:MAG TPA: type II toxin-antitoxin system ParD family antitoxin [Tepidisphaeraceae bacterium]|jgi:antitoxin ParD1/3/4|nr:type II toxin-antitoxin system ParD family antitoxin [Tepidisphaeraceae bacterium]
MARDATINVSLTPQQLRLVRERVESGDYGSTSEVIRESLRMLFRQQRTSPRAPARRGGRSLAAGYKATAAHDRKLVQEWAELPEASPEDR